MKIKIFKIACCDNGLKFFEWLKKYLPKVSFIIIDKLLAENVITVNRKKLKFNTIVKYNQKIQIPIIKLNILIDKNFSLNAIYSIKKFIFNSIVYENIKLIIFNKLPNLCVHGGCNISLSVNSILKLSNIHYQIVHRIDKATTGLIIFSKNYYASIEIHKLLKDKKVYKSYLSISHGTLKNKNAIIESIIKIKKSLILNKLHVKTKFQLLGEYKYLFFAANIIPITGKKHQIRIHSQQINCPILGDIKYFSCKNIFNTNVSKYLHLHSHFLNFYLLGSRYYVKASLPCYLQKNIIKYFFISK